MRKILKCLVVSAGIVFSMQSCDTQEERSASHEPHPFVTVLPNTPELVVRAYEKSCAGNDFGLARRLCTGSTLVVVNSLDSLFQIHPYGASKSNILEIKCKEEKEKAACDCVIEDDSGKAAFKHHLVRQSGQWLIKDIDQLGPVAMGDAPRLPN